MKKQSNTSEMASHFLSGEDINFSIKSFNENENSILNSFVAKVLSRLDLTYINETLNTILREIILNAVKANAKRVYFKNCGLDINDRNHYNEGLIQFKKDVISNLKNIGSDIEKSEYEVTVLFKNTGQGIDISITNNCTILSDELQRILFRLECAEGSDDFSKIYEKVFDSSEGAGLGLILSILLLKNAGLKSENYRFCYERNLISHSFFIPFRLKPEASTGDITKAILDEIDSLPTFPEHILEIQSLCSKNDTTIEEIASRISTDPALTADLLKISNSAGYISRRRIGSVHEAIVIIGLDQLQEILTVSAARKILDEKYRAYQQIWEHCNITAFYARFIALENGMQEKAEKVFIAALLHDIGKIVLLSTNRTLINKISAIVSNRRIHMSSVLEEIAIGVSHSEIGALIAEKWNFPDYLIQTIRNHHSPLNSPSEFSDIASMVYLANMLYGIEKKRYTPAYIEADVQKKFKLTKENAVYKLIERIQKRYNDNQE